MKFFKNLLLVAVSLSVSLLLGEMVIRIISPQNLSGSWRVDSGTGYVLNKSVGVSKHQFGDRVVHYKFRAPHLRDMGIGEGDHKVLVLGDSFTFGWLLNSEDTYISHLQEFADNEIGAGKVQFINGGAGGWGTADYVRFTEEYGDLIDPDCILVFLNSDDIGRSIRKGLYRLKNDNGLDLELNSQAKDRGKVELKRILNSLPGYQILLENSHLLQLVRSSYLKLKSPKQAVLSESEMMRSPSSVDLEVKQDHSQRLGHALFVRLKDWGSRRGIPLMVTTTISFASLEKKNSEPTAAFYSIAPSIFEEEQIPFFDISAGVKAASGGDLKAYRIPVDGHPNETGALLISQQVWPWLKPLLPTVSSEKTQFSGIIEPQ